jgi:hypothetical protein
MDTSRITRRKITQVFTPYEVRKQSPRTRLFTSADSGIGRSPLPATPSDVQMERSPYTLSNRRGRYFSPMNDQTMEVNEAGDDDLAENTTNQWGKFWLIWMSLLAVCSTCVAFAWIKFPENKVVQRSQEYVMAGLLTIMGVMIITIFLKLIWHSCCRESKEMSHGRRAVRYQCPSRDDEGNDYGESEGQCGPYQEPQGFGKVPEHSGTFCMRPDPNGHSFSRSGGQTLGQFSEPEQVQSEADGTGVEVRNSEGTCDPTALASHEVTPIPSVPTNEHQFMAIPRT